MSHTNKTFGFIWEKRSITPFTPKSGEHEDQIAPTDVVAIKLSTVSIRFGIYATTLSFLLSLILWKKLFNLFTLLFKFFQFLSSLKPFSLINVIALVVFFLESKFSAKFNFELGKKIFL